MKSADLHYKYFELKKNKIVEFQIGRWESAQFINWEFYTTSREQDHAGFYASITLFYHELSIHFYDTRHAEERAKEEGWTLPRRQNKKQKKKKTK